MERESKHPNEKVTHRLKYSKGEVLVVLPEMEAKSEGKPITPEVVDLKTFEMAVGDGPRVIEQKMTPLYEKRQKLAHLFYDAKLKNPEKVSADAEEMEWDLYTKVTSRLDPSKEVKLDHNITAMGILGLLTGSDD